MLGKGGMGPRTVGIKEGLPGARTGGELRVASPSPGGSFNQAGSPGSLHPLCPTATRPLPAQPLRSEDTSFPDKPDAALWPSPRSFSMAFSQLCWQLSRLGRGEAALRRAPRSLPRSPVPPRGWAGLVCRHPPPSGAGHHHSQCRAGAGAGRARAEEAQGPESTSDAAWLAV